MFKSKLVTAVAATVLSTLVALPAQAVVTRTYFEQTVNFQYIDGGAPGRGVGDTLIFDNILINQTTGQVEGTKSNDCDTIWQDPSNGDFWSWCEETIYLSNGTLVVRGLFNEIAFEAFQPQTVFIVNGTGYWKKALGYETIQQVRFPDQAVSTIVVLNKN
ncbi:MAG: hypothetical protein H0W44_10430 [Gammaproteobacteria bacterium]|nr:hypothetical protein [Gammaproteobacteria bacterium]